MDTTHNKYLHEIEEKRYTNRVKFLNDPFVGYKTLDESLNDCKITSQAEVLGRLLNRENVFISGPAGSGKTMIVNRFIDMIDAEFDGKYYIAKTASTGIAAMLINGVTIHSFMGMGIDTEPFNRNNISPMVYAASVNFRELDTLIIDEISMLPAYAFEKVDKILQFFKRNTKPFGGVQLILLGDFLQLPPVHKNGDDSNTDFAITTESWKNANIHYCYLDKIHRSNDNRLKYILAHIASNKIDEKTKELLKERSAKNITLDPKKSYTTLFTTNKNVNEYNKNKLNDLKGKKEIIPAIEIGSIKDVEKIYRTTNAIKELELKIGANVILTKNIMAERLYPNGSLGKIINIYDDYINVVFNDGSILSINRQEYSLKKKKVIIVNENGKLKEKTIEEAVAIVRQYPLKLGYAITVHKSQGQTFDGVIADLSKCFVEGLGYVAISRVRSFDDLIITGLNKKALTVDKRSKQISLYVRKKAILERKNFIENKDHYKCLLNSDLYRGTVWDKI